MSISEEKRSKIKFRKKRELISELILKLKKNNEHPALLFSN